jgi:hypothetical protein
MEDRFPREREYVLVNVSIREMIRRSHFLRQYLPATQTKPELSFDINDEEDFPDLTTR